MKKIATLILSCMALTGLAQPTITSSMAPQPGQTETSYDADSTGVLPGNSGANQTWNFSSVTPLGPPTITSYISAASTPYFSSFPNASVAIDGTSGTDTAYIYLQNTSSLTQFLGTYINSGGVSLIMSYSNPQTLATYPFTYNTTYTDLYAMSFSLNFGGLIINNYTYGTMTGLGDAYGTLITPVGTFPNTLRVKTTSVETDSSVMVGFPSTTVTVTHSTAYNWVNGSGAIGLFSISVDTADDGTGPTYDKSVSYGTGTSGIKENTLLSLNSYPNPTTDNAVVAFTPHQNGSAYVEVMDCNGKRIAYWTIDAQVNQTQQLRIKLLTQPAGLYHARILQGNEIYTSRILKQ